MEYKAVLCVIGAILINLTLGTFYSIGNVVPYVASYMRNNGNPNTTTEHGTWITASFLLGQGLFILAGAYIEQKFNSRIACIIGCVLHCASTFATIWAIDVSLLAVILIYGLGSGLGCGSAYMASILAAQKWFPHRKGFFTGLIVAGFGFGGLIFTPLQTIYMNPDNLPQDAFGYFDSTVYSRVPHLFLYMGIIFAITQTVGCLLAFPPPTYQSSSTNNVENTKSPSNVTTTINEDILPNITSFYSVFLHRIFYVIGLMMMLVAPGVTFMNSLGKRFGQSYIKDDRFLATVVAVSAVANALGRLTWGFLMDRFTFSTCFTIKVSIFAVLIATFPFGFILSDRTTYFIWMLGLFFGFSGTFVLFPVFIAQVFGAKYHGLIYGVMYVLLAASSIVTSFIIQMTVSPALASKKDPDEALVTRIAPCGTIALIYVASLALYYTTIPVRRLEIAIGRRIDAEKVKKKDTLSNRQDLFPVERGNLAQKTTRAIEGGIEKENSLGSIVRFRDLPEEKKIKVLF